ncbi:MAG: glycosyltransferase family 2 protein [Flavobacteriales bacterium]|jgi:cellulose synthase/poly-beta-1,6-N-acetylglucosamine synthase-like glycosyltransferase|nr:glycosyltransferase family 2 protein [Flavobacteriales bacterium]|tara:strand:+ start:3751 stop:4761 length:1011 start_codon:yes stop_codon:yes gene_type:complete
MDHQTDTKTLSIVIPCYNEQGYIENCVLSLLQNGYSSSLIEILVVDGGSTDGTIEKVNSLSLKYPQVKLLNNEKKKTPFALNLGIEKAANDYLIIASAHSSFDKGYISTLFREKEIHNADVIGGVMETKVQNLTPTSKAIKEVLSNKFGVGNASFRVGIEKAMEVDTVPFGLYKTELMREIEGYNPKLIRNHDIELSKRLLKKGKRIVLTPATKCYYYARESYQKLAQNNYRNGKWNLFTVFITKDFNSLSLRHFVPLAFVLSILLPLLASLFNSPFVYLSLMMLGIYLFSLILIIFKTIDLKGTTFLHMLAAFITLHFSYGIGSLVGLTGIFKRN